MRFYVNCAKSRSYRKPSLSNRLCEVFTRDSARIYIRSSSTTFSFWRDSEPENWFYDLEGRPRRDRNPPNYPFWNCLYVSLEDVSITRCVRIILRGKDPGVARDLDWGRHTPRLACHHFNYIHPAQCPPRSLPYPVALVKPLPSYFPCNTTSLNSRSGIYVRLYTLLSYISWRANI